MELTEFKDSGYFSVYCCRREPIENANKKEKKNTNTNTNTNTNAGTKTCISEDT